MRIFARFNGDLLMIFLPGSVRFKKHSRELRARLTLPCKAPYENSYGHASILYIIDITDMKKKKNRTKRI